jgi:hypothetical protein
MDETGTLYHKRRFSSNGGSVKEASRIALGRTGASNWVLWSSRAGINPTFMSPRLDSLRRRGLYERERSVTYQVNGIHTLCFEKAGATYMFDKGRLRRVVDSD